MSSIDPFEKELEALREKQLYRVLREVSAVEEGRAVINGLPMVNFGSNDYLGLSQEPTVIEGAVKAARDFGAGAGASRLITGNLTIHRQLEETLAAFKQTEAALVFPSGYAAATGTICALAKKGDVILLDKLAHACLVDGARLSGATLRVFPHNHMGKLESLLQWTAENHPEGRILIVTESIFSMDGDAAALKEIVRLKERHGALLMLDEAHGFGVLGEQGRGLANATGLADRVDVQMGTLSKAAGAAGGYICGSRSLINLLSNRARSFVFTTATPPAVAGAALAAVRFMGTREGEARRLRLWANLDRLQAAMPLSPLPVPERASAIFPWIVGETRTAIVLNRALAEGGFFVPAIRYPTVPKQLARLRVTMTAVHQHSEIDEFAKKMSGLASALKQGGKVGGIEKILS